jgi:multidrug efflux pump subunit AcrA (membrane-fusion protein)
VEQFRVSDDALVDHQVARVVNLARCVLRNAIDYDTLPLRFVARGVRQAGAFWPFQRSKVTAVLGCLLLLGMALTWIPARFYVRAEGELQPAERREIYAPFDGEVVEVHGQHDEDVEQGQVLLVMRSRPLEIELQRLQGDYQTTAKRLFAITSARFQSAGESSASDNYPGELAAEEQELKQLLLSQQSQIQLVREQCNQLSVQSPIHGRVLTWNTREVLEDRPVQKGQLLMSTANIEGSWIIELSVPENRIGHLVAAQRAHAPLQVTFVLASDRGTIYRGHVIQVGARTELLSDQQSSVKVTATVPDTARDILRPGAIIYAKVDCGVRSLGFVWLHDIFEALKARLLL